MVKPTKQRAYARRGQIANHILILAKRPELNRKGGHKRTRVFLTGDTNFSGSYNHGERLECQSEKR